MIRFVATSLAVILLAAPTIVLAQEPAPAGATTQSYSDTIPKRHAQEQHAKSGGTSKSHAAATHKSHAHHGKAKAHHTGHKKSSHHKSSKSKT